MATQSEHGARRETTQSETGSHDFDNAQNDVSDYDSDGGGDGVEPAAPVGDALEDVGKSIVK